MTGVRFVTLTSRVTYGDAILQFSILHNLKKAASLDDTYMCSPEKKPMHYEGGRAGPRSAVCGASD